MNHPASNPQTDDQAALFGSPLEAQTGAPVLPPKTDDDDDDDDDGLDPAEADTEDDTPAPRPRDEESVDEKDLFEQGEAQPG